MVAPFSIFAITLGVLLGAGPLSIQAFPLSRISSLVNDRRGCFEHNIVYALPPTENDVDTVKEQGGSGQMESLRRTLFAELEKMRKQFTEMSESLSKAKEREEKAQGTIATLKEQRQNVESEKKRAVDSKKSEFVEEMSNISDELEGAQDYLRQTLLKTKLEITDLQSQAKEREGRLRSEIADLESRLEALRQEAANAARSRDDALKQTMNEVEDIKATSRKEMRDAKSSAFDDRKAIKRDNYAQETRIQQAEMDLIQAEREQQLAAQETPKISVLQNALNAMKSMMEPQVAEMKERRSANEMFFAVSKKSTKVRLDDDLSEAESEFEAAQSAERENMQQTISSYELKLENKERELVNKLRLSNERADRAVAEAISAAKQNRIKLYEEKFNAVRDQQNKKRIALQEALLTQTSVQDMYDAELENEIFLLEEEKGKAKQRLAEQEQYREDQNRELLLKIEQLTNQLSQQIRDEKAAAEEDLRVLKISKGDELANSRMRTNKALNDIQTARSNLILLQDMLQELEVVDTEKGALLQELEEERSSFRKQLKRTASVAIDRLTLKNYRARRENRE